MRHLSDGILRRIYDEPLALTATDQAHYDTCSECKTRFQAIAGTARTTSALLDLPAFTPEPVGAFRSVRARIEREEAARPPHWYERWLNQASPRLRPMATPAIAVLLAATLLTGVAVTGAAQSVFRIFEPHSFAAVQVSPSDFAGSGALLDYGPVKWQPEMPKLQEVSDATTAHTLSGLPVLLPASLPGGVSGPVSCGVVSHATGSLTLDAERPQRIHELRAHGIELRLAGVAVPGRDLGEEVRGRQLIADVRCEDGKRRIMRVAPRTEVGERRRSLHDVVELY